METVIAALISGSVSLAVCLITNKAQMKATEALILYRLEELEKKQDVHNNMISRMTTVEIQQKELSKDVNELFDRSRRLELANGITK